MIKFSERFKEAREYFEMNKVEFARYLEIAPSTVTRYESGSMDIAIGAIEKISSKLNINMAWLLGLDDNMYCVEVPYKKVPLLAYVKKLPVMDFENFTGFEIISEKYKADFCIKSNENIIFFKKQVTAENGNLVAILDNMNLTLRRYYKFGSQIVLRDDINGLDMPVDKVIIIGKAVLTLTEGNKNGQF